MLNELKALTARANLAGVAVAVALGLAVQRAVAAVVEGVVMNAFGALFGKPSFASLTMGLGDAEIPYGQVVNALVSFVVIVAVLLAVARAVDTSLRPPGVPAPEAPTLRDCPFCYSAIPVQATRCARCTSEVPVEPL